MASTEPPSVFQGVEKSSFGYKLLSTFGWKEGDGLGARRQGIKEHIKVKKKFDALGVGAAEQGQITRDWTTGMVSYDMILSGLKEISSKPAAASSSDASSSDASSSDDDDDERAGSAQRVEAARAPPAPAAGHQSQSAVGAAAPQARRPAEEEASSDEEAGPPQGARGARPATRTAATAGALRARHATHIGRYRRRENAKRVGNYSAEDLAAILGANGTAPSAEVTLQEVVAGARISGAQVPGSDGDDSRAAGAGLSSGCRRSEGGSQGEPPRPSTSLPSELPVACPSLGGAGAASMRRGGGTGGDIAGGGSGGEHENAPTRWWGQIFVRAGRMGNSGSALDQVQRRDIKAAGFSENDQTDLYMRTHDGATQGKQGLGRSSMPKKVAGARWQGTKTRLGDSSDEDGEEQPAVPARGADGQTAAEEAAGVDSGVVVILPKQGKKRSGKPVEAGGAPRGAAAHARGKAGTPGGCAADTSCDPDKAARNMKRARCGAPTSPAQPDPVAHAPNGGRKAGTASKRRKAAAVTHATAHSTGAASGTLEPGGQASPGAPLAAPPAPIKWRKLARQVLADAPKRRLRSAKLHKRILQLLGLDAGMQTDGAGSMLKVLRKASAKFEVTDTHVKLAAK